MKSKMLSDCTWGEKVQLNLMVNKIIDRNGSMVWAYVGDKHKGIKCIFSIDDNEVNEGDVLQFVGNYAEPFKPDSYKVLSEFEVEDYLPTVTRPVEEILDEIKQISKKEFLSEEVKKLDSYFFDNEHFIKKFKKAIGGVYNHHNYIGGLAEHTLGVMKLSRMIAYEYNCKYKEIAILGAKLHDIGKIYEIDYNGPFKYTDKGSLQGHIVIGTTMVEKAFLEDNNIYSEEFKDRIKAIIVQHHGKLEYGSPIPPRTVEAYVVHYADYIDATFNKLNIIGKDVACGKWSKFDKRIEGRILF